MFMEAETTAVSVIDLNSLRVRDPLISSGILIRFARFDAKPDTTVGESKMSSRHLCVTFWAFHIGDVRSGLDRAIMAKSVCHWPQSSGAKARWEGKRVWQFLQLRACAGDWGC